MAETIERPSYRFLEGGSKIGALIRNYDWSTTALGPIESWPDSLKSALSICINSGFPIAIYWGPHFTLLYNDAWSSIPGDKHPWALGKPGQVVWPEIWDNIEAQFTSVLIAGESIRSPDTLLPMKRFGYTEECYFDYTLSPILDKEGRVGGIFNAVIETTYKVINERRNRFLHSVVQNLAGVKSEREGFALGAALVADAPLDIPFCLFYKRIQGSDKGVDFIEKSGCAPGPLSNSIWPFEKVLESGEPVILNNISQMLGIVVGYWPEPVTQAYLLPIKQGQDNTVGFMVAGVSARKRLDAEYMHFLETVATHISTGISYGIAYEEERRRTAQLLESESNFRNMILQAPVAMCIFKGPAYVVEVANQRMLRLWGRPEEVVINKPIFEGLPEVKNQGFEELLDQVFYHGERVSAHSVPVTLPRVGGIEMVYVDFLYEALREADNSITGVMAVATDVTAQVLARQKTEEAEERARLAIESADLGTYEVNLQRNEIIGSQRLASIFGIKGAFDRDTLVNAIIPDDLPARDAAYQHALLNGILDYEGRVKWEDGSIHWIRIKGKLFHNERNEPYKIIGVGQDITEQKIFAEELASQVKERTKALQEAYNNLEKTNADLEQFAYVASHDLQEPLRKIQVFNSLLTERINLSEDARKYTVKIDESSRRMTGLIRDLLEYSRVSKGDAIFQRVNLNEVLRNVMQDYEVMIAQKRANVAATNLAVIDAVPLQMNQLFYNLIGNSLKFVRENINPQISIKCEQLTTSEIAGFPSLDLSADYVKLTFRDNGIGFQQEYAEKIFTIFQRLNERTMYGGYGIGLAICKKIVDSHKGLIFGKGKPDEGSEFVIILPCTQRAQAHR